MTGPRIAACMIVKNSADTIERCLESIRPFVDGVFIYDTGSTDDTVEQLRKLNRFDKGFADPVTGQLLSDLEIGTRSDDELQSFPLAPIVVEQGEWRDDFAWAREQSFAMPDDSFDWMLWLDDDDEIVNGHQLRSLAAHANPAVDGFVMFYDYARDEAGNSVCQLWRERLLRRSTGFEWVGAVHEVAIPAGGRAPVFAQVAAPMIHYRHNRPADRYAPDRNLDILLAEKARVEEAGEEISPRTLAYLGTELMSRLRFDEAAPYLDAYLSRQDVAWSDERMQVAHKLATCLRALGNPMASVEVEMRALRERDDWAETYVGLAEAFAMLERWDRVERWAKGAIAIGAPQTALIVNPLEFTALPALRVAEAMLAQGKLDDVDEWLTTAMQSAPGQPAIMQRAAELSSMKVRGEAIRHVHALREILVRFDENEKAWRLMELAVPYLAADDPTIIRARADQREMVKHLIEPDEYARWYRDEPKESSLTDDHINKVGEYFGRVAHLHEGLKQQQEQLGRPPLLLDLGCNDWWMGEFFARHGIRCDGVELNQRSFDLALERRDRFGRDATIVHGDLHDAYELLQDPDDVHNLHGVAYDAISLFEVFEHVPDIHRTLDVMESLLAPGGRIYISTPDGAFEHGNIQDWNNVVRKGHLRAIPLHELADLILDRGEVEDLSHTDGDRVGFVAYTPREVRGTVSFYAGPQWEPWSATSLRQGGIGGSETALVQVATRMAAAGWKVRVFSSAEPGLLGGVLYRPFTSWDPTEQVDLLVVSRLPHVFANPVGAKQTALWCHDHTYDQLADKTLADKIDHVVVLSDWQHARFVERYPHLEGRLRIIRNGIGLYDWQGEDNYPHAKQGFRRRKPRAIYSSSADRGLDVLLDVWPRIRERVPDAELHAFYGFQTLDRVAMMNPQLAAFKGAILAKVAELGGEDAGVFLRGRVGQQELASEMQEARVLAYPTAFLETSCITAMEARAAGLAIVTSDLGALGETVGEHGLLLAWDGAEGQLDENVPANRQPGWQDEFVDAVVGALGDGDFWRPLHDAALRDRDELDWQKRISAWEALAEVPVLA